MDWPLASNSVLCALLCKQNSISQQKQLATYTYICFLLKILIGAECIRTLSFANPLNLDVHTVPIIAQQKEYMSNSYWLSKLVNPYIYKVR